MPHSYMKACVIGALCAAAVAFPTLTSTAADAKYPSRAVTIIVPFPPGGPADVITRPIADKLARKLGQPFVLEFRSGAAGIIGAEAAARAAPDGYTLLLASSDLLVNNTASFKHLPYNPQRDFALITQVGTLPMVFAVNAAVPANDLREFFTYAQAHRGALSYGSWGYGINAHVAAEVLLNHKHQLNATHVTYRGLAPLTQDLVGQQITASFGFVPGFAQFAQSGQLHVLAVTGNNRVDAFPQVRTFAEQGFGDPIFQLRSWLAFAAPVGAPATTIALLQREIAQIVNDAEFKGLLEGAGLEPLGNTAEEARANLQRELAILPRLIREIGVEPQ
jgi:tripartite-type tricarboxylate transporter receptor subunit TctC